jgi:hypothetical protein
MKAMLLAGAPSSRTLRLRLGWRVCLRLVRQECRLSAIAKSSFTLLRVVFIR